jgi:hypothetical protein
VVAGLVVVVVAGRVTTLEGVTTVRVTVLLGLLVVDPSVLEEDTFVPGLLEDEGFTTEMFEVEDSDLEADTLVGTETPGVDGWTVISVGFEMGFASVRAPVTIEVGVVEELVPPLLKELPVPVVPLASPS